MSSITVRISRETSGILHELSARYGKSMQAILNQAIESYRRQQFLEETNKAYIALKKDSKTWKEELKERRIWDASLADDWEPR